MLFEKQQLLVGTKYKYIPEDKSGVYVGHSKPISEYTLFSTKILSKDQFKLLLDCNSLVFSSDIA